MFRVKGCRAIGFRVLGSTTSYLQAQGMLKLGMNAAKQANRCQGFITTIQT